MIYYEAEKSKSVVIVAFDQFLSESVHGKFLNFQYIQKFRYQAYLLNFHVEFNLEESRGEDPKAFVDPATLSEEANVFSHYDFINKIMSKIYDLIHEGKFPRVIEEMRKGLQLKKGKATGDWFLYRGSIVIRVYSFQGFPYVLLAFLTPIIFYL